MEDNRKNELENAAERLMGLEAQVSVSYVRRRIVKFIMQAYAALGLVFFLAAVFFIFFELNWSPQEKVAVYIGISGLTLAAVSFFVSWYFSQRELLKAEATQRASHRLMSRLVYLEMIEEWSRFEALAAEILIDSRRVNRRLAFSEIIKLLKEFDKVRAIDVEVLHYCLQVRNSIAHGKLHDVDAWETTYLLRRLRKINDTLSRKDDAS
jgi:hypothetical protein